MLFRSGNPLQCSCLEYPRDRGACWAAVSGVAQSRTQLKLLSGSSSVSRSVVLDSVRPHGLRPTRLCYPWDTPGKNTGVGCHFLLQCIKVKSESEVAQSCPTLSDPMDCSLLGSSVHGIFQARVWSGVPLPSPGTHDK